MNSTEVLGVQGDQDKKGRLQFSLETVKWEYTEFVGGKKFMSDSGRLYGFSIKHQSDYFEKKLIFLAEIHYLKGNTDYDGALSDGSKFTSKSDNNVLELRGIFGFPFNPGYRIGLTPYFGYSHWVLTNGDDPSNPYDYGRKTVYRTIPVGINIARAFGAENSGSVLGIYGEYSYFLSGKVKTKLSDVHPVFPDLENKQNKGKGYAAGLNFKSLFEKGFALGISTYYRVWKIADSDLVTAELFPGFQITAKEPESTTKILGLNLYLQF